ncbi:kinesin-like protein klp-3 [Hippocampus comes]|uniref:kinesin-like protein klp-3 n=1 Tax=Hippocampus comes TaxID=109280 RepID=UPI00094E0B0E|nr:PREDICTED: kinesin-like protein klp-3 [Hippocampus comes]
MGSGASTTTEGSRLGLVEDEQPDLVQTPTPVARTPTPVVRTPTPVVVRTPTPAVLSGETFLADDGHEAVDVLSVTSDQVHSKEEDKEHEATSSIVNPLMTEMADEDDEEEVSVNFENFLHNNGTLYSCFEHHGNRVYVDDAQKLQPFPKEWYDMGRFISPNQEVSAQPRVTNVQPAAAVDEDDRTGSIFIPGKGSVMTYMFEERVNVCRFWDPHSGVWLLLPLQWEMNVDFVQSRVHRVMSVLPGLLDQKEITAALRLCNYDSEEVISAYLTMFGEVLLHANNDRSGETGYSDLNSFRALLEREHVIDDLRQQLESKQREADEHLHRNELLVRETRHLGDIVQNLHRKTAELEADRQEAREKIRFLQSHQTSGVTSATNTTTSKPAGDPDRLRRAGELARELKVSAKQLRSWLVLTLSDLKNALTQTEDVLKKMAEAQRRADSEAQTMRSLYQKEALERRTLYNKLLELQGNVRVFCRCRNITRPGTTSCLDQYDQQEVTLIHKNTRKKFFFDKVYGPISTQEEVFAGMVPLITSCADGYNVCILAYGQTGSGKTFTMMGTKDKPGVNVRSIRELLRVCSLKEKVSYVLKISMLEIYNDTLNDLLAKNPTASSTLDIRVQGKFVSVPGLTHVEVRTEDDIINVMDTGEKNRKMAATKMNIHSSRSHLLVALEVCGNDSLSGESTRGTLTLGDLAGSERISRTEAEGPRLVEAAAINKSLTALGQVFAALKSNALHVPFRNCKLTHLLQPSLSGDAKCCVFVNVSPEAKDEVETLSTLQFGSSIRHVALGKATKNLTPTKGNKTK